MLVKSPPQNGHTDPRTKRTRELILKAFSELIEEKGFDSITVQEIADRATVNRATFYAHFEDKYLLLDYSFAEWFKQVLRSNLPPAAPCSPQNLQLLIQTVCEFLGEIRDHCVRSVGAQFDSLIERQVKMQLYDCLLGWLNTQDTDPADGFNQSELRATVASWAIYGAALRWSQGERQEPVAKFAHQVLPIIMAGLDMPGGSSPSKSASRRPKKI